MNVTPWELGLDDREVFLPLMGVLLAILLPVIIFSSRRRVLPRFRAPGRCPRCQYDISAGDGDSCPECGWRR